MRTIRFLTLAMLFGLSMTTSAQEPVRIAIAGLSHGHVGWILGDDPHPSVQVVGLYEPDPDVAKVVLDRYEWSDEWLFDDLDAMLASVKPEAVAAFGPTSDHPMVVRVAASHGIHVMVEKPMANTLQEAEEMVRVAEEAGIQFITNYETSWYATTHESYRMLDAGEIGDLRKVVVRDGHMGPAKLKGLGPEFLEWLNDPVRNGGGAITDFGCYGSVLLAWLARGERPIAVTAITQNLQPDLYPNVDDEATIVVEYEGMQGIIQASWNWPFHRKDMTVYGTDASIATLDADWMVVRRHGDQIRTRAPQAPAGHEDPFAFLARSVRGTLDDHPGLGLWLPEVNLRAMEILDAAIRSAREGRRVELVR